MKKHLHGSPYDRGSADRYYGRDFNPHYYDGSLGQFLVKMEKMTAQEIVEYTKGYNEETDRKDWG
jgi:hypothetical protein